MPPRTTICSWSSGTRSERTRTEAGTQPRLSARRGLGLCRVVAESRPRRASWGLDQLDEHSVARARVNERDGPFSATARRLVDELETLGGQSLEFGGNIVHFETDV